MADFEAGTTAFAVKARLLDEFKALLPGIQVVYGDPIGEIERECIMLGRIEWAGDEGEKWGALGNRSRIERYSIELNVNVQRPGEDSYSAETAANAHYFKIEGWLRENPSMSFPGRKLTALQIVPTRAFVVPMTDEGREAQIDAEIRVECHK